MCKYLVVAFHAEDVQALMAGMVGRSGMFVR